MQPPPRCVAVLRFSSLGDILLTTAALQALAHAWPQTRIVYVTHAHFAPLVAHHPAVHAVVGLERGESVWQLRQRLKNLGVDAVLDLHGKLRGALLRASLPGGRRAVWNKRAWQQTWAVRLGGARYQASMTIAARYHAAVERLVGRPLLPGSLRYEATPAQREHAENKLMAGGWVPPAPLVGLAPGAMWGTKRWPTERFAALARQVMAQGSQVVLTGSGEEAALCQAVLAAAPGAINLGGGLDLETLGGVIALCSAFVANDSGPMHMARALGVPTLTFFGSTDPGQFDFSGHALMYAALECSPCSFHGLAQCPRGHLRCLRSLEVEDAWSALKNLLSQGRAAPVPG